MKYGKLRLNHKKKYAVVMNTLLYEWYDDDGYLEICANEYCEKPITRLRKIMAYCIIWSRIHIINCW